MKIRKLRYVRPLLPLFLLPLMLPMQGCFETASQSTVMKHVEGLDITSLRLRTGLANLKSHFAVMIERTADEIIRECPADSIRERALIWKMNAIPAAYHSTYTTDPFIALLDSWTFTLQMRMFFEQGNGVSVFGECTPKAVEVSRRMVAEIRVFADRIWPVNDSLRADEKMESYAAEYPIHDLYFDRSNVRFEMSRLFEDNELGSSSTIHGIADDVNAMKDQLEVMSAFLPRQARWEAQYLTEYYYPRQEIDTGMAHFARITASFDDLAVSVAQLEGWLSVLERHAMGDVDRQRLATIDALRRERIIIQEALHREREAIMLDVKSMTTQMIGESFSRTEQLLDGYFWRFVILIAILTAVIMLFIVLIRRNIL